MQACLPAFGIFKGVVAHAYSIHTTIPAFAFLWRGSLYVQAVMMRHDRIRDTVAFPASSQCTEYCAACSLHLQRPACSPMAQSHALRIGGLSVTSHTNIPVAMLDREEWVERAVQPSLPTPLPLKASAASFFWYENIMIQIDAYIQREKDTCTSFPAAILCRIIFSSGSQRS